MKSYRDTIKKKLPALTESIRWCKRRKNELSALKRHIQRKNYQKKYNHEDDRKIIVVFICQYIPAWSKNKQLYETLKKDERFKTVLLCIPNRVAGHVLQNPDDLSNDTYEYFMSHGYADAVNSLIGKNTWLDLKAMHPDYVIYNRYDRPMPIEYTSTYVSTFAKVCLIKYSSSLFKIEESMFDKTFAANTYCFFTESESIRKEFIRWNKILCKMKLSNAIYCGIPAIENAYKAKNDYAKAWEFSQDGFRVMYTPRWTMDPTWGGSSFLKYRDVFLKISDDNPEMDILLRPHPLMLDHFINAGLMSKEEVEIYINECNMRSNIRFDTEKEYHATFWNSNVLVTDFSSMIIEYFITGKPIIYLTYDEKIECTEQMKAVLESSYIVNNEDELRETLTNLANGNDPLAEKRKSICKTVFPEELHSVTSENMKQVLLEGMQK